MKYFLLIGVFFAALWIWRRVNACRSVIQPPPVSRAPEKMVKCAYCGVNQPVSESILAGGRYFCSIPHRQQAEFLDD